jgi:hypothetical protein
LVVAARNEPSSLALHRIGILDFWPRFGKMSTKIFLISANQKF